MYFIEGSKFYMVCPKRSELPTLGNPNTERDYTGCYYFAVDYILAHLAR
jgi:hypothetical protein